VGTTQEGRKRQGLRRTQTVTSWPSWELQEAGLLVQRQPLADHSVSALYFRPGWCQCHAHRRDLTGCVTGSPASGPALWHC